MAFDQGGGGGGGGGRPYSTGDMAAVLFFLRACERDHLLLSAITAEEAFEAACRIMELPADPTRRHLDKDLI